MLDSSMLVREWRRWKAHGRWKLMLAAGAVCGWLVLCLVASLAGPADYGAVGRAHASLAGLTLAVIVCSSALAFYQSMQALRREVWAQTLEGLFLTLQSSRGVMLSIAAGGLCAGGAFALLFFPAIVVGGVALSMSPLQIAAVALFIVAMLVLASGLGAVWFFVSSGTIPTKWAFRRVLLDAIGVGSVVAAATAAHTLPQHNSQALVGWLLSLLTLCAMAGVVVWAVRTVLQECRERVPERLAVAGGPLRTLSRWAAAMALLLALLFGLGMALVIVAPRTCGVDLQNPTGIFLPTVALLFGYPFTSGALAFGPFRTADVSVLSLPLTLPFLLLAGAGMIAASIRLYRQARQQPELITATRTTALGTVAVGRDDWKGVGNPILTRELRTRLRSGDARMFLVISALLSIAAGLAPLLMALSDTLQPSQIASIARSSFLSVSLVQMGILCLVGPGIGAEVIAAEKEKKTYDMLLASQLSAGEILWGKLLGCLALLTLLISPACPLLALAAILHGVTALSVVLMIAGLFTFALVISAVSVSISALAKSSVTGKWTAYVLAGLLFVFSAWGPVQLSSQDSWALQGGIWVFLIGNAAAVLWFSAESKLQGPRRPARRPAYLPSEVWEAAVRSPRR